LSENSFASIACVTDYWMPAFAGMTIRAGEAPLGIHGHGFIGL
jgi:hypothetical protein